MSAISADPEGDAALRTAIGQMLSEFDRLEALSQAEKQIEEVRGNEELMSLMEVARQMTLDQASAFADDVCRYLMADLADTAAVAR